MPPERRISPREALELPITLGDGSAAVTRNISAQGVYITTAAHARFERWVRVEYELPDSGLRFTATGEVLRVEQGPDFTGVAIRLHSPDLQALD